MLLILTCFTFSCSSSFTLITFSGEDADAEAAVSFDDDVLSACFGEEAGALTVSVPPAPPLSVVSNPN